MKSEWGVIPGKCKEGNCIFTFGGNICPVFGRIATNKSHSTQRDCRITCNRNSSKRNGSIQTNVRCNWENEWGLIPGKVQRNTCWFPYAEKREQQTTFTGSIGLTNNQEQFLCCPLQEIIFCFSTRDCIPIISHNSF